MKNHHHPCKTFALLAAAALAGCASPPRVAVPDPLQPGADEALARVVPARGVQVYQCRAVEGPEARHAWAFVAPEAELLDASGKAIGRHGAGPVWQAADGSTITGAVKARAEAPRADAIPWLLLAAKVSGPDGAFSKVTSIQRVNTVGGIAPATGCTRENAGVTARVGYTADYHFFSPR